MHSQTIKQKRHFYINLRLYDNFSVKNSNGPDPLDIGDGGGDIINLREANVADLTCVEADALEIRQEVLAIRADEDVEEEICCEEELIKQQCGGVGSRYNFIRYKYIDQIKLS